MRDFHGLSNFAGLNCHYATCVYCTVKCWLIHHTNSELSVTQRFSTKQILIIAALFIRRLKLIIWGFSTIIRNIVISQIQCYLYCVSIHHLIIFTHVDLFYHIIMNLRTNTRSTIIVEKITTITMRWIVLYQHVFIMSTYQKVSGQKIVCRYLTSYIILLIEFFFSWKKMCLFFLWGDINSSETHENPIKQIDKSVQVMT